MRPRERNQYESVGGEESHVRAILVPLVEDYTVETTITVVRMNPAEPVYDPITNRMIHPQFRVVPDWFKTALKSIGYTRLYLVFLFTRAGDLTVLSGLSERELIRDETDELYSGIIRDSSRVVLAYGNAPSEKFKPFIQKRAETIRRMARAYCRDSKPYCFGAAHEPRAPKIPEAVTLEELKAMRPCGLWGELLE